MLGMEGLQPLVNLPPYSRQRATEFLRYKGYLDYPFTADQFEAFQHLSPEAQRANAEEMILPCKKIFEQREQRQLQDLQMQLKLLEQENRKRLMLVKERFSQGSLPQKLEGGEQTSLEATVSD